MDTERATDQLRSSKRTNVRILLKGQEVQGLRQTDREDREDKRPTALIKTHTPKR